MSDFELSKFIPFRLNRLADEVSRKLSEVYKVRFGISVVEWRILTTLAAHGTGTAKSIVESTRTHKSRISRAVARLMEQGLLERLDNDADRRAVQLRLSAKGRALHRKLVPLILEQEQNILSCLSKQEVRLLSQTIDKLERSLDLHDETNSCAE